MASFKDEVLDLVELLEFEVQHMRDCGESDLRSVINRIRNLHSNIVRLEEDGEYHNG